jgi:hypothetical protein
MTRAPVSPSHEQFFRKPFGPLVFREFFSRVADVNPTKGKNQRGWSLLVFGFSSLVRPYDPSGILGWKVARVRA